MLVLLRLSQESLWVGTCGNLVSEDSYEVLEAQIRVPKVLTSTLNALVLVLEGPKVFRMTPRPFLKPRERLLKVFVLTRKL